MHVSNILKPEQAAEPAEHVGESAEAVAVGCLNVLIPTFATCQFGTPTAQPVDG